MSSKNCAFCSGPAKHGCRVCQKVVYCKERTCFENDKPLHDYLCGNHKKLLDGPRPSPTSKLGVLFPELSKEPKLIWVDCIRVKLEDDGSIWERPVVASYLGAPDLDSVARTVTNSESPISSARCAIFYCKNDKESDEPKINICLSTILDGKPPSQWRGPLLILSLKEGALCEYQDIGLTDSRVALDFMIKDSLDSNHNTYSSNGERHMKDTPIMGVRINCEGDRRVNNMAHFVQVYLKPDRSHPIYRETTTDVSMALGLPILLKQCMPSDAWKDDREANPDHYSNCAAKWLTLDTDANSPKWGDPDLKFQVHVGSVLVVAASGKNLDMRWAYAISQYCEYQLANGAFAVLLEIVDEVQLTKARRDINGKCVTKEAFRAWCKENNDEVDKRAQKL